MSDLPSLASRQGDSYGLAAWNAAIDTDRAWTMRRIGRLLLWIGAGALIATMFFTPPWMNGGLGLSLLGAILSRPPLHRLSATWFGLAYALWLAFAAAVALIHKQPGASMPGEIYGWLPLPLVAAAVQDRRWRMWTIRTAIALGALGVIVGLLQFLIGNGKGIASISVDGTRYFRARGLNTMHLTFGFTASLLAILAAQPATRWGISAAWAWTGRIAALTGLGICGSRAGSAAGIVGLGTTLAARGRRWLIGGIVIATCAAILIGLRMGLTDSERLTKLRDGDDGRWLIWQATVTMIKEQPLLGIGGRKAYKQAYNDVYQRTLPGVDNEFENRGGSPGAPHAHNWLLAEAAEYGLPCPLLHLIMVGAVLVACWRRRSEAPGGWQIAAGVAAVGLVGGMFEPYPTQSVPGLAFHGCLGLGLGLAMAGTDSDSAVG